MKIKLFSIQIDGELIICDEGTLSEVKRQAGHALKRGKTVTWEDKRTQWMDIHPVINHGKSGADAFVWDISGNKIRCERFLFTKCGGKVTEEKVGGIFSKITSKFLSKQLILKQGGKRDEGDIQVSQI